MRTGSRRGVAYGTATAAGAAALLGLVLPQISSTVKPTRAGTILIALAVGLVTIASQRYLDCRRQRNTLEGALRIWPPTPFGNTGLGVLGVFPPPKDPSYCPRPEDDEIEQALDASDLVVVHGPAGAGKSRAAAEAARRQLPDYVALIPVNAEALKAITDSDGGASTGLGGRACLWLDDLDRFIDALDCLLLERLESLGCKAVKIIVTVRTQRWRELLGGNGEATAAARALATDGQVVTVPRRKPSPHEELDEAADVPEAPTKTSVTPLWRDRLLLSYAGGLVAIVTVILLVQFAGLFGGLLPPPSLTDQMNQVMNQMLNRAGFGGGHPVINERVPFHQADADSWVIGVEDNRTNRQFVNAVANCDPTSGQPAARAACESPLPRSDELRIYDVRGGRLQLAFDYRPQGIGKRAAQLDQVTGAEVWADYDNDDAPDLILAYEWPDGANTLLPFGVYWQDGAYQLQPLSAVYPDAWPRPLSAQSKLFIRQAYRTEMHLTNMAGGPQFRRLRLDGDKVQAVALVQQPSVRLLTGYYPAYPGGFTRGRKLDLYATQLRADLGVALCTHSYYACRAPAGEEQVLVPPDRDLGAALLDAWQQVGPLWRGRVKVVRVG